VTVADPEQQYAVPVFTGIVREKGRVVSIDVADRQARLLVAAPLAASQAAVGDSVAIDGVCLTAVAVTDSQIAFDAVPETLRRTSLGGLEAGDEVNVEPALRAGEPLGGHYVQGHVDAVGRVASAENEGDGRRVTFDAPPDVLRYCAEKGSITVDGVSLTVAGMGETGFTVALIPHTLAETTLGALEPGDEVNLEVDVLAKYVERLLTGR
jgi:riboflavin synthase